jgi:hypothetical protein
MARHPGRRDRRGWVESFSSGEPAFRSYVEKTMTKESLAKKSVDQRMVTYRELRERFGKLSLASVVKSTPGKLDVKLMTSDASITQFTFDVQTAAPWRLIQVSRREYRNVGHGGFGDFHH